MWSGFSLISRMGGKSILTPYDIFALRLATASLVLLPFIGSMPKNAWRDGRLWLLAGLVFVSLGAYIASRYGGAVLKSEALAARNDQPG